MSNYLLANCTFHIDKVTFNDSKWTLFRISESDGSCSQAIYIREIGSDTFKLISPGREPFCVAGSANCIAHLLDEKLYGLCAETLISQGVIHLHSAFVLYEGKAILFTGPSGIGKTTQAELWRDCQGAEIINGDVTLIRKMDGKYCAFGAPIHGTSPYCENKSAPIAAVIVLQQGKENRFESLDSFHALRHCLPEIYRPAMSEENREILWGTVDDFFSQIPVYRLTCRPDREATELARRELGL